MDSANVRPAVILAGRTAYPFLKTEIIQYLSTFFFWKKIYGIYHGMNHDQKSSIMNSSTLLKNCTNIIQFSD